MDKSILEDYIDACEFIKETEAEIKRLKKKRRKVIDKVRGSNPDFPYEPRSFSIAGTTETYAEKELIQSEEHILEVQKRRAEELKIGVEEWMENIPFRMKRIIKYKFFHRLSWEETATLMGRKCTAASVKMEFQRFMKEI
ncbi:RNA polymerase subunit sigma-70 [Mediterraneibacter sp. NSJ-55]|uniref:RNA polymerase subunit sigma-70 n=1 Tax=Mediterraneibacter hominis TaxID=2763054 RepID=A0A923LK74_9FIRM|nr:RNA polymerase subunit sigma-70 [Mediterraneibacter hominis]MBC5689764.1 RNA polymerase subunit sigma-70 [Mediterraneibacter hominis]